ncbi:hypothetical protein ATKI12_5294 [Kitasatospora sp. Ki12]
MHVSHALVEKVAERVDLRGGATVFPQRLLRDWSGKERIRSERLRAIYTALNCHGLRCYPSAPICGEDWPILIYRTELANAQFDRLGPAARASLKTAVDILSVPYSHSKVWELRDALLELNGVKKKAA